MSKDLLPVFKTIYEYSGIPTAIADRTGCIIWKNKASGFRFNLGDRLVNLLGKHDFGTGLNSIVRDEELIFYNLLRTEEDPDEDIRYVVEIVRSEKMLNILNTPAIKDYMIFLSSKIRNMAGMVVNSADEIYDAVSCGIFDGQMITDQLNIIDKGIMSIAKEIVQPDQFYYLMNMSENEVTLSMENELRRAVNETETVFGKKVKVSLECENDIFFRMDRSLFETVLGGFAAKCCETYNDPEKLIYSAGKISSSRAEVSVTCVCGKTIGKGINSKKPRKNDMFFSYICDVLCSKIGAVFTRTETPDSCTVRMEFNIISKTGSCVAMTGMEYSIGKGHFGTISLMLADAVTADRYTFYDIDAEDMPEDERHIESTL